MSGRAFRRAVNKEYELVSRPKSADDSNQAEEESDYEQQKTNLFDLLNEGIEGIDDEEEQNSDENEKAKQEKVIIESPVPTKSISSKKKKKRKKISEKSFVKNKENHQKIDNSIKEFSEKFDSLSNAQENIDSKETSSISSNIKFLTVDPRLLDADGEMKRMFSSRIVDREIRDRNYIRTIRKTLLAKPRQTWPPIVKFGLGMDLVEEKDGIYNFEFTHSQQYQATQISFLHCIATHDSSTIFELLRKNPYHIDSLLQISDIYKMSDDHAMSSEFIERALYAFEKSFHIKFNISKGISRLNYNKFENRAFFLALFRQIQTLSRRGCWQTSFEFSKLLLSLDPVNDPLCVLHIIDYIGLKAKQYEYVISFTNEWEHYNLKDLPNFSYSSAIAKFQLELKELKESNNMNGHKESTAMLEKAILYFPTVVPLIVKKCDIQLDSDIEENEFLQETSTKNFLNLLIDLYVEQNSPLWTQPEVITWFQTAIINVVVKLQIPSYKASLSDKEFSAAFVHGRQIRENLFDDQIPLDISRYIIVSENSKFLGRLPAVVNRSINLYDPLPPPDGTNPYSVHTAGPIDGNIIDIQRLLGRVPVNAANLQAAADRLVEILLCYNCEVINVASLKFL
ncbi:9889_t:CDS:10 [Diversispora eburnea]|uniref:9889_t:CDS:1 n=1 Tax=Diversispora eburnea TaxID=1213867 RepID=A0A9N9A125_9GLOM|nr:9889_t:CDS:10 [Diversispora eburnea]